MRIFVTGGAGFIGRSLVRLLHERGDELVLAVRDPSAVPELAADRVALVASDLSHQTRLAEGMRGADAVIHAAGRYRVGIAGAKRAAMWDANVGATERVLAAAEAAGIGRTVYVSTVNVLGDTHGAVPDETHRRDLARGFLSRYDETKFRAHEAAEAAIERGQPVIVVMPGTVIGPGDHSGPGDQLRRAHDGTLRYRAVDELGLTTVHVDDVAAGIVAALDRGRLGRSYILAGAPMRMGAAVRIAARLGGRRLPRLRLPSAVLRATAPLVERLPARVRRSLGLPDGMREVVSASSGVTYWASNARARTELGWTPRDPETAIRDTLTA